MTIRALLFDFDGVLWDSESVVFQSWRETFEEHGAEFTLGIYATMLGTLGGTDPLEELERQIGRGVDRDVVAERRRARTAELIEELRPRDGVVETIDEARRRGWRLGLVSTDETSWITNGLRIIGLLDAWDIVECAERDRSRAKPSPALYLTALERLGLSAREAIAIEDSPNGIAAAKAADLFCVAFANDITRQLDLSAADVVVDDLRELPLDRLVELATA